MAGICMFHNLLLHSANLPPGQVGSASFVCLLFAFHVLAQLKNCPSRGNSGSPCRAINMFGLRWMAFLIAFSHEMQSFSFVWDFHTYKYVNFSFHLQ